MEHAWVFRAGSVEAVVSPDLKLDASLSIAILRCKNVEGPLKDRRGNPIARSFSMFGITKHEDCKPALGSEYRMPKRTIWKAIYYWSLITKSHFGERARATT